MYLAGLPSPNNQRNLRGYLNEIAHLLKNEADAFSIQWGTVRYPHKSRTVYVTNGAQEALHDWLALRGAAPGATFTPINKGGRVIMW